MASFRPFLLLLLTLGLILFAVQNRSPVLSLVLLGHRSPAFPLSVWLLGAVFGGAGLTVLFNLCFRWSNFLAERDFRRRYRPLVSPAVPPTPQGTVPPTTPFSDRPSDRPPAEWVEPEPLPRSDHPRGPEDFDDFDAGDREEDLYEDGEEALDGSAPWDDWEAEPNLDWEETDPRQESPPRDRVNPVTASEPPPVSRRETVPREVEPRSDRPKTTYSFRAGEAGRSSVGRVEDVYDAEYRVLIPPYRADERDDNEDGEDYGEEGEDEDFSPYNDRSSDRGAIDADEGDDDEGDEEDDWDRDDRDDSDWRRRDWR